MELKMNKLFERIYATAREHENRIACVFGHSKLTYGEMMNEVCRIAKGILAKNQSKHPVGIYLDRSEKVIITMLGAMMAGCAYIPIDKRVGEERVREMLNQAKCNLVIADEECLIPYVDIKQYDELVRAQEISFEQVESSDQDVCYIIFTPLGFPVDPLVKMI